MKVIEVSERVAMVRRALTKAISPAVAEAILNLEGGKNAADEVEEIIQGVHGQIWIAGIDFGEKYADFLSFLIDVWGTEVFKTAFKTIIYVKTVAEEEPNVTDNKPSPEDRAKAREFADQFARENGMPSFKEITKETDRLSGNIANRLEEARRQNFQP